MSELSLYSMQKDRTAKLVELLLYIVSLHGLKLIHSAKVSISAASSIIIVSSALRNIR